ncbi:acetyl-CoA carboxylase biotin carboxyl carrier protein [Pseudolactococcus insecticola]|uniref:acetyl-CoA carboxylase biotin carboxyl carrier protein n=1 Tax=Pseudolactococcus insecticola TaxID=2709158 RepID=UPI00155238A0|nr:acetyl-CoA carboxylase biotin carboxyl carrier protein [Lactococcus insecticola]
MQINEVKDLLSQFDGSSLREFSYATNEFSLSFSKNQGQVAAQAVSPALQAHLQSAEVPSISEVSADAASAAPIGTEKTVTQAAEAEGDVVTSPLVGVAYLKPAPDKSDFISVGETVKKGQTLLIIEAMKVMNEIPAPRDGVITEILVDAEAMVEYGEGLVRIK